MTTTVTIDCLTCPVRGRLCGDCFVPVLGRTWLGRPGMRPDPGPAEREDEGQHGEDHHTALDRDELAAVGVFVRAGLVSPDEAAAARAAPTRQGRAAATG
jgi:hypothetical protein